MLIAGVLCMSVAVVSAAFGLWALRAFRASTRSPGGAHGVPGRPDPLVLRAVAPAQLASAAMLAAGGAAAMAGPPAIAFMVLVICVVGAVGTLAAGSWQSARYAMRRQTRPPLSGTSLPLLNVSGCGGDCACSQQWPEH